MDLKKVKKSRNEDVGSEKYGKNVIIFSKGKYFLKIEW